MRLSPRFTQALAVLVLGAGTALTLAVLAFIIVFVLAKGLPWVDWEFLTAKPRDMGKAGGILPTLVGTFRAAHPEVTVSVRISGSHEIARKVLAGEYDLGLVGAMWNERGLDWTELFTDTLVLVARPDHPLAGRGPVTLDDLCGQDYVGREPGSGTRKVIGALLETAGRRETDLHQVALFGANEAVREAVKAGVGVSMLSRRSVAADLAAGTLVEIFLVGVSGERPFYLLRRKNRQLPPSAAALAEHLVAAAARNKGPAPG